ncbi:DUF3536 domain-containing protein [Thermorudis peleae]|uniref:DUF3536 domain-containing protein n=1 Tax=Thermorudis peleae TaxID=1382356 RepID=UPI0005716994|nr:DUF3536 domain-containing protein [Thermorudis peleae]
MAKRFICVHGHFYQPPRENPWLEVIEVQDSAYPYHDWNARITAECYGPNAWSRILNDQGKIMKIVNNYARMSFNFGPTLIAWLADQAPAVYERILEADRESLATHGHGSAIAQAYNHLIMPLANTRDKRTQVRWGIADFVSRFGRHPEGMWLPETAVDLETLDILAEHGITFTILAPYQARRVRPLDQEEWQDVEGGRVDPSRPYLVRLPSGRTITVFFYDGGTAHDVAFGGLLNDGHQLAARLLQAAPADDQPHLVHIATDGETFGHHHRFGDMALAAALETIEQSGEAELTNYAAFLEHYPPTWEAEIIEQTSWSCAHGVERWRSNCGCNSGMNPGWTQEWRQPLREAMDWLRDELAPRYEEAIGALLHDPWEARDDYIHVILDRSPENVQHFFERWQRHPLSKEEQVTALKLLELQRHALLMYTSCGWFFDEISGIETVQVIQYAARAIQLAREALGIDLESGYLEFLERAPSNVPEIGNGRVVYERFVKPAQIGLAEVAAHYAISALFENYPEQTDIACYTIQQQQAYKAEAGRTRLLVATVDVTSTITKEDAQFTIAALHLGEHNVLSGVLPDHHPEQYKALLEELKTSFEQADIPALLRVFDQHFSDQTYSLRTLFRDEQRKILTILLDSAIAESESSFRHVYEDNRLLMQFLHTLGAPIPRPFLAAAEVAIEAALRQVIADEEPDLARFDQLLDDAEQWGLAIDYTGLAYAMQQRLEALATAWHEHPEDSRLLQTLTALAERIPQLREPVNTWNVQNLAWDVRHTIYPTMKERADNDPEAATWVEQFQHLCDTLWLACE